MLPTADTSIGHVVPQGGPQSTPVSRPLASPSSHDDEPHLPSSHFLLKQSVSSSQPIASPQGVQRPPQSRSVSEGSCSPLIQMLSGWLGLANGNSSSRSIEHAETSNTKRSSASRIIVLLPP